MNEKGIDLFQDLIKAVKSVDIDAYFYLSRFFNKNINHISNKREKLLVLLSKSNKEDIEIILWLDLDKFLVLEDIKTLDEEIVLNFLKAVKFDKITETIYL